MYAQNMMQLLHHVHGKEKAPGFLTNLAAQLELGDELNGDIVVRSIVTSIDGRDVKMPPPPDVGKPAAPASAPAKAEKKKVKEENPLKDASILAVVISIL